jgi:hypothetical protein
MPSTLGFVMYVILKQTQYIVKNGKGTRFKPGDGVDVSPTVANACVKNGIAEAPPDYSGNIKLSNEIGFVVIGSPDKISHIFENVIVQSQWMNLDNGDLPFEFTCIWNQSEYSEIRCDLLMVGFRMLQTWQVAMPLFNYDVLASDIVSDLEAKEIEGIIRDLRVPVYDPRIIFIRRSNDTADFLRRAHELLSMHNDPRIAVTRAIYEVKPLILALPTTWTSGRDVI